MFQHPKMSSSSDSLTKPEWYMWYYLLSSLNVWSIKPHRKPLFSFKKEKEKKEGYVYAGNLRFFRKNNYKIIYCLKRKLSSDITLKDLQVKKKKA